MIFIGGLLVQFAKYIAIKIHFKLIEFLLLSNKEQGCQMENCKISQIENKKIDVLQKAAKLTSYHVANIFETI